MRIRIGRLRYNDSLGRPVYCQFYSMGGEVLFLDRSDDHNGMSITNSIEEAIEEYTRQYPDESPVFFEAYEGKTLGSLNDSLTQVTIENGIPFWNPPTEKSMEKWINYFAVG